MIQAGEAGGILETVLEQLANQYEKDYRLRARLYSAMPAGQVFKTLCVRGDKTGIVFAVIPGDGELNLKALAKASGNKKAELVHLKEVLPLTGYIRGGVSPVGAKKHYPVYLDSSAANWPYIAISAGMRGLQLLLKADALLRVTNGNKFENI